MEHEQYYQSGRWIHTDPAPQLRYEELHRRIGPLLSVAASGPRAADGGHCTSNPGVR